MKRIIAVMAAFMFAAVLYNINVSAMTKTEYEREYLFYVGQLENGYMTYEEFEAEVNALTSEFVNSNTDSNGVISSVAETVSNTVKDITIGIGEALDKSGEVVFDWIADVFSGNETTESVPTTDMQGAGAIICVNLNYNNTGNPEYIYYGEYGIISGDSKVLYGYFMRRIYYSDGTYKDQEHTGTMQTSAPSYAIYGNWTYDDGTQAPTDDEYTDKDTYDFSDMSDSEIDKLLQQLLEELERQNPDLSTMEGLLESIYYRLGTLDSDDDNALLAEINAAIVTLSQDGQTQNLELISKLDELKDVLGEGETSETDLSEITDELKSISSTLKGLAVIEVAENLLELTDSEQKLFDEYANLIPLLVDKVGLAVVSQTMHDIETVIFTTSAPSDLNITLFGEEYTLLSTETFSDDDVMQSVNTIKTFISVILIYVWCIRMRRLLI